MRLAVTSGHFGPDVAFNLERLRGLTAEGRADGADLLVLPHGVFSGYHDHLDDATAEPRTFPEPHDLDGPEVQALIDAAGSMVVCFGMTERVEGGRCNTAVCVDGSGVLGIHRKAHLPRGELGWYEPGASLDPVPTPVGTIGLLVDYDKTFPEAARTLAVRGAELLVVPCAWPASRTHRAHTLVRDRQRRLFDLYDQARAAENQVWLLSANQTGRHGDLRFLGLSKIVAPDGSVVASTGVRAGMVSHDADVRASSEAARRRFHHLAERRGDLYDARQPEQTESR